MRLIPLLIVVLLLLTTSAPVTGAVINPSIESQPWYCRNSLTKWMCEGKTLPSVDYSRAYPVGTIFITMSDKNPSVLLGFGKWQRVAQGRVLFGQDGNVSFLTPGQTGGNYTQNISAHKAPT